MLKIDATELDDRFLWDVRVVERSQKMLFFYVAGPKQLESFLSCYFLMGNVAGGENMQRDCVVTGWGPEVKGEQWLKVGNVPHAGLVVE